VKIDRNSFFSLELVFLINYPTKYCTNRCYSCQKIAQEEALQVSNQQENQLKIEKLKHKLILNQEKSPDIDLELNQKIVLEIEGRINQKEDFLVVLRGANQIIDRLAGLADMTIEKEGQTKNL
jgi:iron only hydrogenase large subunit-like protein